MEAGDAVAFVDKLERGGFVHMRGGRAEDFIVVEDTRGLLVPCDWAEFARVPWICAPLGPVAICKRPGTPVAPIVTPDGWDYQRSLSKPPEPVA